MAMVEQTVLVISKLALAGSINYETTQAENEHDF